MSKLSSIGKQYFLVVFGILLFLFYLNGLGNNNGYIIAIAILGVLVAAYYIANGLLAVLLPGKLPERLKNIFAVVDVIAYPAFFFVTTLLAVIVSYDIMGPTGWIIAVISMVSSLGYATCYALRKFLNLEKIGLITNILGGLFLLSLLLNVLFEMNGNPVSLGNLNIIVIITYAVYVFILYLVYTKVDA